MNFATFERAQVAAFAYSEARITGSLDCMRAICFIIRNRVKAGWTQDGSWLSVIASSDHAAAHDPHVWFSFPNSSSAIYLANGSNDRLLQLMIGNIDDIYLGQVNFDDSVMRIVCTDDDKKPGLYYSFVNQQPRPWFVENIIRNSQEHAHVGNIGPMMIFR